MKIKVVGLKEFTDRHGTKRRYWKRTGTRYVAIDPLLKGAALAAEIARLEEKHLHKLTPKTGTLRALITDYKTRSEHWSRLAPRTRKDYERVFSWLGEAVDSPITLLTPHDIVLVRDKAKARYEAKFANQVVITLKAVMQHGVDYGEINTNPAAVVSKLHVPIKRGNRACTPEEAAALLDHAPTQLLPVIAVALYCGVREGDICRLPRNAIKGDWLEFTQSKTKRLQANFVVPMLRHTLSTQSPHNATTLLASGRGTPWTEEGVKSAWERLRNDLEERGLLAPGATFHGLRHTGASLLADLGFEESEVGAFLGHGPKTVSGHYMKSAKRRALLEKMARALADAIESGRTKREQIS